MLKTRVINCAEAFGKHLLIWSAALCLIATGCSGSDSAGGGGDDDGYKGKTTPAVINTDNADKLSDNTMEGKSRSDHFAVKSASTGGEQSGDERNTPYLVDVSMAAKSALEKMDVNTGTGRYKTAKAEIMTEEIQGDKGGSAIIDMELDRDTGQFNGTMTLNEYCNDDMALSGYTSFSGIYNSDEDRFESFSMTFEKVTGKSESETIQMDGDVCMKIGEEKSSSIMTMVVKDLTNDRTYKFKDYKIVITEDKENDKTELEISGRIYHPDEGYVDIATTTPFVMEGTDTYPSSGIMELTGEKGEAGGPTKARLTVISNTQCQVETDTNGDGTYDHDSGIILWDDLSNADSEPVEPGKDDTDKVGKPMEANADSCFKLSTGAAQAGVCNDENDGDIYFWEGAKVDIHSDDDIFCLQEGEFTNLESIPGNYSDCDWTSYIEGGLGLVNAGVIVKDASSTHYYKMRIMENELPTITFEYEAID